LLSNGAKRERLIGRAGEGVANYALTAVAARYEGLFEELSA